MDVYGLEQAQMRSTYRVEGRVPPLRCGGARCAGCGVKKKKERCDRRAGHRVLMRIAAALTFGMVIRRGLELERQRAVAHCCGYQLRLLAAADAKILSALDAAVGRHPCVP